jgi:phage shock protein E
MRNFPFLLLAAAFTTGCGRPLSSAATTASKGPVSMAVLSATTPLDTLNVPAAKVLLAQPGTLVLDVRTPEEFLTGHLLQARNLDVTAAEFTQQITQLDYSKTYVVYCRSGKRSSKAIQLLRQQGFQHLINGGSYDGLKE